MAWKLVEEGEILGAGNSPWRRRQSCRTLRSISSCGYVASCAAMRFAVFSYIVPRNGFEESAFLWDGMGVSYIVRRQGSRLAAR